MTPPNDANPPTDEQRRAAARLYVQQLRAFYVHAAVFAASMVVIFGVNLAVNLSAGRTGEWSAWWAGWALIGWGIGVAVHGIVVRLARPNRSASTWEQRQIEKILSDDNGGPRG